MPDSTATIAASYTTRWDTIQQVVDLLGAQMLLKFASSRQIFGSRL